MRGNLAWESQKKKKEWLVISSVFKVLIGVWDTRTMKNYILELFLVRASIRGTPCHKDYRYLYEEKASVCSK